MDDIICELCAFEFEFDDDRLAERFGWVHTWDGWMCPACDEATQGDSHE